MKSIQTTGHRVDFSSGRIIEAPFTSFAISVSGLVYFLDWKPDMVEVRELTAEERKELAALMIERWKKFGEE